MHSKPNHRPRDPRFSSGPTRKHPGWSLDALGSALIGRAHRSAPARERQRELIARSRKLLELPDSYHLGMMLGSNTGAFEAALWSLLGERPVDVLAWDVFGRDWRRDIIEELCPQNCRAFVADYGATLDLASVDCDHDLVFVVNGTTTGAAIPDFDWIDTNRRGLTIADATSAVFARPIDWDKIDVLTYSWQKCLGGESAHGMIVLSPRAVARLERYQPPHPIPKLFRLADKGVFDHGIFDGSPLNTPSLLCIEDALSALSWAENLGGAEALYRRCNENAACLNSWIEKTDWVEFLCTEPSWRSNTSICFYPKAITTQAGHCDEECAKSIISLLTKENIAVDIEGHPKAPLCLRVWTGPTIERDDLAILVEWLDWAYLTCKHSA